MGGPGSTVTGHAALFLWGIEDRAPHQVVIAVASPQHLKRSVDRVRFLRTRMTSPPYTVQRLAVAEPEIAIFHAVKGQREREGRALALRALSADSVSTARVQELVRMHPRAPGRGIVRRALALYDQGVRSILEADGLRDVLYGATFANLARQHTISVAGRRFRVDAFDGDAMLAIEFDGRRYHATAPRWEADRERDTLLATLGILTLRFTFLDVTTRPEWCREQILRVRALRMRSRAA